MKIIYALFYQIENAISVVDRLMQQGASIDQMNAVVQQSVAKLHLKITNHLVASKKSCGKGEPLLSGLECLLGGVMPLTVSDLGSVYAGGKEATMLIKTAAALNNGAFYGALKDFQIPQDLAADYKKGVQSGALLFWIRTSKQAVYEFQKTFELYQAQKMLIIPQ